MEAPGTAPGSERLIANTVYRHSQALRRDAWNIGSAAALAKRNFAGNVRFCSSVKESNVIPQRMAAEIEGDFVVFLIGMRINKWWKLHRWLPPIFVMPKLLKELEGKRDQGFLGAVVTLPVIIQYWRSFEHLEAYARDPEGRHFPAWSAFNRRMRGREADVGVWHETYLVRQGNYEAVYSGMPPHGWSGRAAGAGQVRASRAAMPSPGQRAEPA